MKLLYLGEVPYQEARDFIRKKIFKEVNKKPYLIFCEHPRVLTLGKNFNRDLNTEIIHDDFISKGISVLQTDRGGQVTFHDPGQLMIYPILDLKSIKFSVRLFVESVQRSVLSSISDLTNDRVFIDQKNPGLWVEKLGVEKKSKIYKMGSSGFRIIEGVSDHGFSLNISGDLKPYNMFNPCGILGQEYINLIDILKEKSIDKNMYISEILSLKYLIIKRIFSNLSNIIIENGIKQ